MQEIEELNTAEERERKREIMENLGRFYYENGFWEFFLGLGILFSSIALGGTFSSPALKGFIRAFYWIFYFIMMCLIMVQINRLRKKFPELSKQELQKGLNLYSSQVIVVVLFMVTMILTAWKTIMMGAIMPSEAKKIALMMLCLGAAASFSLAVFYQLQMWKWALWGFITLAYVLLIAFSVITLSNFYLFTLPLGVLICLSGIKASLRKGS